MLEREESEGERRIKVMRSTVSEPFVNFEMSTITFFHSFEKNVQFSSMSKYLLMKFIRFFLVLRKVDIFDHSINEIAGINSIFKIKSYKKEKFHLDKSGETMAA